MVAGEVVRLAFPKNEQPDPFFCDMTALSSEQRARHHELAALLQSSLAAIRELPDGYDFDFP